MAKIREHIEIDDIGYLLNYCSKHPELYNDVANRLYSRFHITGAELCLLVTYCVAEDRARQKDGKEKI